MDNAACTCHVSNLKCKNPRCTNLIQSRGAFKSEVGKILQNTFRYLKAMGYERKECIKAMRREIMHKNGIQLDLFDEIANQFWEKDS